MPVGGKWVWKSEKAIEDALNRVDAAAMAGDLACAPCTDEGNRRRPNRAVALGVSSAGALDLVCQRHGDMLRTAGGFLVRLTHFEIDGPTSKGPTRGVCEYARPVGLREQMRRDRQRVRKLNRTFPQVRTHEGRR